MTPPRWAEAWAPAAVGNVSVGFDLIGHSLGVAGDRVRVERAPAGVEIQAIEGVEGASELPPDPALNTAGAALLSMTRSLALDHGFRIRIRKGIPVGSGMGGSGASAVAAVVAASALFDRPPPTEALYRFALDGESVATASRQGDNVGPQLLGGLVLALPDRAIRLPLPWPLHCALVRPRRALETRRAREVLREPFPIEAVVRQSEGLARLLGACFTGDLSLLRGHLVDALVEPRRAPLIEGFAAARDAALEAGALGAGISGGGPALFAWCETRSAAGRAAEAMASAFDRAGIDSDRWSAPVEGPAAEVRATG